VEAPEVKKILKETDGLGTEATRAGIIELLFKRQFLQRQQKNIRSTEAGRALIMSLPDQVSKPDMTAQWESALDAISQQQLNYQAFMQPLQAGLEVLISKAGSMDVSLLQGIQPQRSSPGAAGKRRRSYKSGARGKARATVKTSTKGKARTKAKVSPPA